MPWRTDSSGDKKYFVSIYAKEELPTWAEVYEEFFLNKQFIYDPGVETPLDLYWNIPRKKILIASVCNQFNKMLFEDGLRKEIIPYISKHIMENCCDIRFTCELIEDLDFEFNDTTAGTTIKRWQRAVEQKFVGTDVAPPIYTFPLPTGKDNPFITSNHPRININDITESMCLFPLIEFHPSGDDYHLHTPLPYNSDTMNLHDAIINLMMKQFKEYFEGSGIGWKDDDGNLIETDPMKRSCDGAGFDPAL